MTPMHSSPPSSKVSLVEISAVADLGYVGVEGIEVVPLKRSPEASSPPTKPSSTPP
jgi:hypothetical protein